MKKTTAFFLVVGILAMFIGAIGSAVYFRRAEVSMTDFKKESYEIKNKQNTKEIHLDLSGNASFYIVTENTNQVTLQTRSSIPVKINSTLEVKEQNNQLNVAAKSTQSEEKLSELKLDIFNRGSAVTLTIPDDTERLIIDGKSKGTIHLSDVTTKDLSIEFNDADINATSINADKLAIETTNGYLNIYSDVKTDAATFKTTNGDININDFAASNWSVASTSGDVSLNAIKGNVKIETTNGDIQATDLKGEAEVNSAYGDISLYGTELPKKLVASSQSGDIQLHTEEILYDVAIKAKSKFGDITIFGKERTSYKRGKETKVLDLQTKSGSISVEGPSDYEDGDDD